MLKNSIYGHSVTYTMIRRFPLDKTRNVLTRTRQRVLVYNY